MDCRVKPGNDELFERHCEEPLRRSNPFLLASLLRDGLLRGARNDAVRSVLPTLNCHRPRRRARATTSRHLRVVETSARRHFGADFGAQLVDQLEALLGLDVPEGPAV